MLTLLVTLKTYLYTSILFFTYYDPGNERGIVKSTNCSPTV